MKYIIIPTILSLALIGCAGKNAIKENNIVAIRGMHLSLKASSELGYIDTVRYDKYAAYENAPSSGNILINKQYVFLNRNTPSPDQVLVITHIEATVGEFSGDLYRDREDTITAGGERIGNTAYESVTELAVIPIPVQNTLSEIGITPKNYYIAKRLGRLGGPGNRHILEIAYFEALGVSNTKLKDWENPSSLSEAQKLYLKEFDQRASQALTLAE